MKRWLPLLFALIKFFSGYLLLSPAYDLQRDEYLYLDQGRHLAWGYLEVPPLLAAQAWATNALGGAVANPYARERGTAVIVGRGPGRAAHAQVRREWREALAQWEGR